MWVKAGAECSNLYSHYCTLMKPLTNSSQLSLPIWRCLVEHSVNTSTNTEDIFQVQQRVIYPLFVYPPPSLFPSLSPQACLGQCRAVSVCEAVAILYLDWAYLKGGIKKARRVYKRYTHTASKLRVDYESCM